MNKRHQRFWTGLFSGIILLTVSDGRLQPAVSQAIPGQELSWWNIFQADPPVDNTPGGKRGGSCLFSPRSTNTNTVVWSDRPLFVWQGSLRKIELRLPESQQIIWSQTVTSTQNHVTYTGDLLKPGQTYEGLIFQQITDKNPQYIIPFKVIDTQERNRILLDLLILGRELQQNGATPDEITFARANYFAQKQLWSDVLQEVYSLKNPSPAVQAILKQIPSKLCFSAP